MNDHDLMVLTRISHKQSTMIAGIPMSAAFVLIGDLGVFQYAVTRLSSTALHPRTFQQSRHDLCEK